MPWRLLIVLLLAWCLAPAPGFAQVGDTGMDLAAMVLSPRDPGLADYLHTGAFDESLSAEAAVASSYRGNPGDAQEFQTLLEHAGFLRKHVSNLQLNSANDPGVVERYVRSYITVFADSNGASTAFSALEDETGVTGASDVEPSRLFGEDTDLTHDGGYDAESRPFRSLDLTFRIANLVAGVTLIVYPTASGFEPEPREAESLAALLEAKLLDPPVPSVGVSIARLDPALTVTYDDTYYRAAGTDLPLADESEASRSLRIGAYGEATTVYQLFQGLDGAGSLGGLYSVTLYEFADAGAAGAWLDESSELITANDYYTNLEPVEAGSIDADRAIAYRFGPFGAPPKARITLAQLGNIIVRVQVVPNGAFPEVPVQVGEELMNIQLSCLAEGGCVSIALPPLLTAYLQAPPLATPVASPASGG